jgi:hypothetical protein
VVVRACSNVNGIAIGNRAGAARRRSIAALLALALALLACGEPQPAGPQVGSNSNWLKACTASEQCDDAPVCECGACTEHCASDADCDGLGNARCALGEGPAARSACGGMELAGAGMCLPRCSPGSCDDGQACVGGACVLAAVPDVAFCAGVKTQDMAAREREDRLLELLQSTRVAGGALCGAAAAAAVAPELRLDPRLMCAARVFARDVEDNGFSGLTDSQGRTPENRLSAVGYRPRQWGESYALRTTSAEAALEVMIEQADNCMRLTSPQYVDVGVGLAGDAWIVTIGAE